MKAVLKSAFDLEIADADAANENGDFEKAFAHLERAHIIGQRYFVMHMLAHLRMLRIARLRRDDREIRGQIARLFAVTPAYLLGWAPKGNTGGANVSALKPMAIPDDLAPLLRSYHIGRDVFLRLAVAALAAGVYVTLSPFVDWRSDAKVEGGPRQTSAATQEVRR